MQTDDKIVLVARVFVSNEEMLEDYRRSLSNLLFADNLARSWGINTEFGVKVTIPSDKINPELIEKVSAETRQVLGKMWTLYDVYDRNPGVSFRQILFNHTFITPPLPVVMSVDTDFAIIETEDGLRSYLELGRKLLKDKAFFAIGSRDQPVHLAIYERNSELRQINELFHSLAIGTEKLRVIDEDAPNVTQSYKEIGESSSGVYALNLAHSAYPELDKSIIRYIQNELDFRGFIIEYYTAIKSSVLGSIATGYVTTRENPVYGTRTEFEEFEHVRKLISYQTEQLGKTDVAEMLYLTLKDTRNVDLLSQFYDKNDVLLVRGWMQQAIEAVR